MLALKTSSIAIGATIFTIATIAPIQAASLYSITGLDFLPSDINNKGQIVGENYFRDSNGAITDLRTLPGGREFISANGINNNGEIVGIRSSNFGGEAFKSDGNKISSLPEIKIGEDVYLSTNAYDINDAGTIALTAGRNYNGPFSSILQDSSGNITTLAGARNVYAPAINNSGQAAGSQRPIAGSLSAYFYNQGTIIDLLSPLTPYVNANYVDVNASDINDKGSVVGTSNLPSLSIESPNFSYGNDYAVLWRDPNSYPIGQFLGSLGGDGSRANGINNSTEVVGSSRLATGTTEHAFLWTDVEGMLDLNSLVEPDSGWELTSALEINDSGSIIGVGQFNGEQRGFVAAKAVPEPSSILGVLSLGAFGGTWFKRQQRQKKSII